jgi:hypothetical protein
MKYVLVVLWQYGLSKTATGQQLIHRETNYYAKHGTLFCHGRLKPGIVGKLMRGLLNGFEFAFIHDSHKSLVFNFFKPSFDKLSLDNKKISGNNSGIC